MHGRCVEGVPNSLKRVGRCVPAPPRSVATYPSVSAAVLVASASLALSGLGPFSQLLPIAWPLPAPDLQPPLTAVAVRHGVEYQRAQQLTASGH